MVLCDYVNTHTSRNTLTLRFWIWYLRLEFNERCQSPLKGIGRLSTKHKKTKHYVDTPNPIINKGWQITIWCDGRLRVISRWWWFCSEVSSVHIITRCNSLPWATEKQFPVYAVIIHSLTNEQAQTLEGVDVRLLRIKQWALLRGGDTAFVTMLSEG